jgi:phosphatidylglycerophosphate synthase
LALIPFLAHFVEGTEVMGLLGGGKLSVITEMLVFLSAMFVVILMPNLYEMKHKHRLILVAITFYFTIQSVLFARVASEFLYFQF